MRISDWSSDVCSSDLPTRQNSDQTSLNHMWLSHIPWKLHDPQARHGASCGLHRVQRLMRDHGLKARPRRRRLPPDLGERQAGAIAPNVLDRSFEAAAPNRKWIADFTYIWTAEGWLYVDGRAHV